MNALSVFDYDGAAVRTIVVDGEPWFVLSDLCRVLDISNPRNVATRLDEDEKGVHSVDTLGGAQNVTVVNESGMYQVVLRSDKPEAKRFRWWLTHEVLPAIRRTGQFGSAIPTTLAAALELAAAEARRIEALEARAAADAPKVAAYDAFMDAEGYFSMEAAAKIGGIGRTTLFRRLREAGVIQNGSRLPYQRYMHWFKITVSPFTDGNGVDRASETARVLPSALHKVLGKAGITIQEEVSL